MGPSPQGLTRAFYRVTTNTLVALTKDLSIFIGASSEKRLRGDTHALHTTQRGQCPSMQVQGVIYRPSKRLHPSYSHHRPNLGRPLSGGGSLPNMSFMGDRILFNAFF